MEELIFLKKLPKPQLRKFTVFLGKDVDAILKANFKTQLGYFINYLDITYGIALVADSFTYKAWYTREMDKYVAGNNVVIFEDTLDVDNILECYKIALIRLFKLIDEPF